MDKQNTQEDQHSYKGQIHNANTHTTTPASRCVEVFFSTHVAECHKKLAGRCQFLLRNKKKMLRLIVALLVSVAAATTILKEDSTEFTKYSEILRIVNNVSSIGVESRVFIASDFSLKQCVWR